AAKEARAVGIHNICTLVIEPNRDPRMGRNEEAYSEDTYLTSLVARAIVEGAQGDDISASDKVIATLCHFPGQSQAVSGLEFGPMEMSERSLREVFLPPWEEGITNCGALGVMATHPSIDALDGLPAHASKRLLTNVLREELGFKGVVLGEGNSIRTILWKKVAATQQEAGILAINAGLDVSISLEPGYMEDMIKSVREGKVPMELIDRAVRRILRMKFQLGLFENPYVDPDKAEKMRYTAEHQELAVQSAREGIVLLKNDNNLLPLKKDIKTIAVIGPNADDERNQLGDYTPSYILQDIVTVLDGIKDKVSSRTKVVYVKGCDIIGGKTDEIKKAARAAGNADAAVVVVGESIKTVGEKRDVANLDLTGMQQNLIKAVYKTGTPTVVVLINGRPLSTRWTSENIPAIVEAWNCGEKGGHAVADVLFGDYNPSGRLAITIPRHSGQLPVYYNYKPSKAQRMEQGYVDMSASPLYE
ncbi:glycoside hydrolase family 3 C-terminal domain-containing protein, partial [bacterium]|nr:glycoside hydrolase family 3 C-terminal domain-containing protein [bacterium]